MAQANWFLELAAMLPLDYVCWPSMDFCIPKWLHMKTALRGGLAESILWIGLSTPDEFLIPPRLDSKVHMTSWSVMKSTLRSP